jgi:hypothetical protein
MTNAPSKTLSSGKYTIGVDAKRTRLPIVKEVMIKGELVEVTRFIPMEKVTIQLLHDCGDLVIFNITRMGRKETVSRHTNLPKALARNLTAFGPELIEVGGKPHTMPMEKALSDISRMTGLPVAEIQALAFGGE